MTTGRRSAGLSGVRNRLSGVRIDLHTHSTASDGTLSPSAVIEAAADSRLDVIGLTDHDSAAGWAQAADAAAANGLMLVPGMEVSTKHAGAGVHLLAYLADPAYPFLDEELALILQGREARLAAVLEKLRDAGIDITEDEVRRQADPSPAIGRPHIADVLVAKGVVGDRSEAFDRLLDSGQRGYVERYAAPTAAMIRLVTQAGGAAVIAHPWGRGSRRVLDLATLTGLREAGLVGLEVDHQDHSREDRGTLRGMAAELDLVVTGASDFHGDGKVDHELGCNLTAPAELERLLAAAAANAAASGRGVPEVVRP